MGLWDKFIVPPLISCACATKPIMKQREKVVPLATGRVLELGCGSGTNFQFYDASKIERLYALEPSPEMMKRARSEAWLVETDRVSGNRRRERAARRRVD